MPLSAALALAGAGAATAAPGLPGSPQAPCSVVLASPGDPITAEGTGAVVTNAAGTVTTCHAAAEAAATGQAQVIKGQACIVIVSASGRVNAICR